MVRVTGLGPVRRGHTPSKRACLPVPAHSHISNAFLKALDYITTLVDFCQPKIEKIIQIFPFFHYRAYHGLSKQPVAYGFLPIQTTVKTASG